VSEADLPAEVLVREREIHLAQSAQSGKPADIVEKMVAGRMKKFIGEVTLLGQPFVKDPEHTVGALLARHGASVTRFVRYEVGDGIEKKEDNFAEEVMAQARSAAQR
jgi:elongation factor Ts